MKRFIFFNMLLLAMFLATSCSWNKEEKEKKETEKKVDYIIGAEADNAPYFYLDAQGKEAGLYAKLLENCAKEQGFTYAFREVSNASAEQWLKEGNGDGFIGTLSLEKGEESVLLSSDAFYKESLCLITKPDSGIQKKQQLADVDLASRAGSEEQEFAKYMAVKYGGTCVAFSSLKDALEDEEAGYAKAVVLDQGNYNYLSKQTGTWNVLAVSEQYESAHCIFVTEEKRDFLNALWSVAQQLKDGDTFSQWMQEE